MFLGALTHLTIPKESNDHEEDGTDKDENDADKSKEEESSEQADFKVQDIFLFDDGWLAIPVQEKEGDEGREGEGEDRGVDMQLTAPSILSSKTMVRRQSSRLESEDGGAGDLNF